MADRGVISFFKRDRGFGFITSESHERNVHFQESACSFEDPDVGTFVEFEAEDSARGLGATTVWRSKDEPDDWLSWAWARVRKFPSDREAHEQQEALRQRVVELEKLTSWNGAGHPDCQQARRALLEHPLATEDMAGRCIQYGVRQKSDFTAYEKLIKQKGPGNAEARKAAARLEALYPHLRFKIEKTRNNATALFERGKERRKKSTVVAGKEDHRIQKLRPAHRWRLFVDETGSSFLRDAFDTSIEPRGPLGRFVAVLVPEPIPLDELAAGFHFVNLATEERDRVFQHLLDAPVGLFGVTADGLPETRGDRWVDGATHVIDWVLRLLPMNGPTEVRALVEERGSHSARKHDWRAISRHMLSKLTETNPERFRPLKLTIDLAGKNDSPFLGYADAVAHTWSAKTNDARTRRKQSKLVGVCLHNGRGTHLIKAWDRLHRSDRIDPEDWRDLIHDPDATSPLGISRTLLDQLARICRDNPDTWERYFNAAEAHLDSKAIDLRRLSQEVVWLASCKPADSKLSKPLELAWLTAELQSRNHRGFIDEGIVGKLEELSNTLYNEHPRLVCQADLVRAVLMTNMFRFKHATEALSRWIGTEMVVPGQQNWARVQSSLGQHAAFVGALNQAEDYFVRAIEAFGGLSDPDVAAREIAQTATYRAIAAMDRGDLTIEEIRARVADVVSLDLDDIRALAADVDPATKYRHHLLLRYLAQHGSGEERAAYLEQREDWDNDVGHPWQLIQAYRATLLRQDDPDEAVDHMKAGFDLVFSANQGPTMDLIGWVLGAIAMGWGHEDLFAGRDLDALEEELPAAEESFSLVRRALNSPLDPPESLLRATLPFNFR